MSNCTTFLYRCICICSLSLFSVSLPAQCDLDGGILLTSTGADSLTICAGDGMSDAFDIQLTGQSDTTNSGYLITDDQLTILGLPAGPPFDLEGAGDGTCLVWAITYANDLTGLMLGENAADLSGCFALSTPITVIRRGVDGGVLTLPDGSDSLSICAGDGMSDAFDVVLTDTVGSNFAWVITDADLNILGLPGAPPFDLEGAGPGICLLWALSFEDGLVGAEVGANAADLEGCFDLSNPITIDRRGVDGGVLTLPDGSDSLSICAGDGMSDAFDVVLTDTVGSNFAWVITDADLNILGLPGAPPFDLEGAGPGICLLWALSFEDGLVGAEVGANAADLEGCFDLSNPITIDRRGVDGGVLTLPDGSDSLSICAGDGMSDAFDVVLTDTVGSNFAWVITDADLNILGLPGAPPFDLEGAGPGICLLWALSFEDGLVGAEVGANAADLEGCFDLSNPITIDRRGVDGGVLTLPDGSDSLSICAGDGMSDAFEVVLTDTVGSNFAWVITDADLNILGLPGAPPFDLEGAGPGICLVWGLSFEDGLTGAVVDSNAANLEGCFDLSNPITVLRNDFNAGECETTSTRDRPSVSAFEVRPNPVTDRLQIAYEGLADRGGQLFIMDVRGAVLETQTLAHGAATLDISVGQLPAGIYLARITSSDGSSIRRFVKR